MKKYIGISLVLIAVVFMSCKPKNSAQQSKIQHVSVAEFAKLIAKNDGVLIDVRTQGEIASGHIKGALFLDYLNGDFQNNFPKISKDKPVYLYCRSGNRSNKAALQLVEKGYTKVYNLQGGYGAWIATKK